MLLVSIIYFFAVLLIAFILGGRRNAKKYTVKLIGILLLEFSLIEYTIKLSNYHTFMQIDYDIYLKLFNVQILIYTISLLSNVSIVLILVSGVWFANEVEKIKTKYILSAFAVLCVFLILNSNTFLQYLKRSVIVDWGRYGTSITEIIRAVSCAIVIWGVLYPYKNIAAAYRKSVLIYRKKKILNEAMVWFLIDLSLILFVFGSHMDGYLFYNLDTEKFPYTTNIVRNDVIVGVCIALITILITILIAWYSPIGVKGQKKRQNKILQAASDDVVMLIHAYKNAFCSVEMFANKKNDFVGNNEQRLNAIEEIVNEQIDNISQTINMFRFKEIKLSNKKISIDNCINKCIKEMALKDKVSLSLNLNLIHRKIMCEETQIIEILRCVINNALEAVSRVETPCITITTGAEGIYNYILIRDNGCGIPQKELSNVFNPLFSLKQGAKNLGLGLSYVKKNIKTMGGDIKIQSKEGEYTLVQIVIPRS